MEKSGGGKKWMKRSRKEERCERRKGEGKKKR